MTISTVPRASPSRVSAASFAETKRDSCRTLIGKPRNRSEKLWKCWRDSSVVGAITATCTPDMAATKAARIATSVLPKPTSPQISRSIGVPDVRSSSTSADGLQLVVGLLIGEPGREGVPHAVGRVEDRGLPQRAFGGDADQPVGDLADALLQPRLLGLPGPAAQPVEKPLLVAVAAQKLDVLHRQVKPVAARVFQKQAFVRGAQGGHHLQPLVAPDPVVDMHDQVAGRQALRLGQEVLGPPLLARRADQPVAQDVLFRDDGKAAPLEPVFERPDRKEHAALRLRHIAEIAMSCVPVRSSSSRSALQPLARAFGIAGDDHRSVLVPSREYGSARAPKRLIFSCWRSGAKSRPMRPPASITPGPVGCGSARSSTTRRSPSSASQAASSR